MTESPESEFTNADRAERCQAALESYNDEYDIIANLIDLLADARHWCDRHEKSFAELDHTAYQHYLGELDNQRRPS
jgi:hypothetical protein